MPSPASAPQATGDDARPDPVRGRGRTRHRRRPRGEQQPPQPVDRPGAGSRPRSEGPRRTGLCPVRRRRGRAAGASVNLVTTVPDSGCNPAQKSARHAPQGLPTTALKRTLQTALGSPENLPPQPEADSGSSIRFRRSSACSCSQQIAINRRKPLGRCNYRVPDNSRVPASHELQAIETKCLTRRCGATVSQRSGRDGPEYGTLGWPGASR